MKATSILFYFFVMFVSGSCSSDLDFTQAEDIELQPVVVANLASFDIAANQLINNGTEQTITLAATDFTALQDDFLNKYIVKMNVTYEVVNTINRGFVLNLFFIDPNAMPVAAIRINVPAAASSPVLVQETIVFEGSALSLLKQAQKISYVNTLLPGPALTASSTGNLKLRSKATAYFTIQ